MAQKAKCQQAECDFAFDDAEHYEDALTKMRAHYRLEHRNRAFRKNYFADHYDQYNKTLDELVAGELGVGWRTRCPAPSADVINTCRIYIRYTRQYPRELLEEIRALSAEHGAPLPELDANTDTEVAAPAPSPFRSLHYSGTTSDPAIIQISDNELPEETELEEDPF